MTAPIGGFLVSLLWFFVAAATDVPAWGFAVSAIAVGFWIGVLFMQREYEAVSKQADRAIELAERFAQERDEAMEGKP